MSGNQKLEWALFLLRASVAAFFTVWAIEKFVKPETTVAIWKAFYFVGNLPPEASYGIGLLQLIAVFCFFFGVLKFWSYGFLMVIHALSTLSSYERLMNPYDGHNHLFWAAVPTLAALIVLFMMRESDVKFTLSRKIQGLR